MSRHHRKRAQSFQDIFESAVIVAAWLTLILFFFFGV